MDVYAAQIVEYLRRFVIPEDYQAQILTMYRHLQQAEGDTEGLRRELEGRLERIRDLYEWGDKAKDDYLSESREIKEELAHLTPPEQRPDVLGVFRGFLENVATAWEKGKDGQKNRLARQMFDVVWTSDEKVVAVRPRAELRPFFQVSDTVKKKVCLATPTGFEVTCAIHLSTQCTLPSKAFVTSRTNRDSFLCYTRVVGQARNPQPPPVS